jgi:XTP/dITP diphosphohydrolase
MLDIVIATTNRHKFKELAALLAVPGIRWRSLSEFPKLPMVKETGTTFEANAIKKAKAVARATAHLTLADDSGLEVEALGGAPGIRSARFAGRQGNDRANNARLLWLLRDVPMARRGARYRCVLALAAPRRLVAVVRGRWQGRIALRPSGRGGFGYDPLFLVPRFGKTVGQLPLRVKQRWSHRADAARRLRPMLTQFARINDFAASQGIPGTDRPATVRLG